VAEKIASVRVTVKARAGEEGKLFGSVTTMDLERELAAKGLDIERKRIRVEEPIKHVGEHKVSVQLGVGVTAEFTVVVEAIEPVKSESQPTPAPDQAAPEPAPGQNEF